jgi:hypothetical protein
MTVKILGRQDWSMSSTKEGHRDYSITWLCETTSIDDGPYSIFTAIGLPRVGTPWRFGNETDLWAFCMPDARVSPVVKMENIWTITQHFSTVPQERCQDQSISNPLNEPITISGSFTKYRVIVSHDKDDKVIKSSGHDIIEIERDNNRPQVRIGANVLVLPLDTISNGMDSVNGSSMWGLPKRCIKLSSCTFQRKLYGTCFFYYTLDLGFDINYNTHDEKVPDRGKHCLPFKRDPSTGELTNLITGPQSDPSKFVTFTDPSGHPSSTLLDGNGNVLTDADSPSFITPKGYPEMDFLSTFGLPESL